MKTLAITGLSGVIGTALSKRLSDLGYQVYDLYHNTPSRAPKGIRRLPLDLTKPHQLKETLEKVKPDTILHMAAITHIDTCEKDKKNGREGIVWRTNVEGTRHIAEYCRNSNIPIVYMSTECVFDGTKEFFDEKSKKHPINWYGQTKSEAEDILLETVACATILRAVMIYDVKDYGKTLLGKINTTLKKERYASAVIDQHLTPTYAPDVVEVIIRSVKNPTKGVFHVSPNAAITPYDFARLIAEKCGHTPASVKGVTLENLYGRARAALRLRHASLWATESARGFSVIVRKPQEVIR